MPKTVELDNEQVVSLYAELQSIDKVADRLWPVSRTTIKRRLKAAGVELLGPRKVAGRKKKRCHRCKKTKPLKRFHKCRSRGDGRSGTCRRCLSELRAENDIVRRFGITLAEFDVILEEQGGGCGICGATEGMQRAGKTLRLCVDHCHKTNRIRGILCNSCNNGIGRFKDDPTLLRAAADYLENKES